MKFIIFACLVAAALARHETIVKPSDEESASVYLGKYKLDNNMLFKTTQDSVSSSSSEDSSEEVSGKNVQSEEEKVNLNQQKKIKQFSQESSFPKFCIPFHQQQSSVNQWPQTNTIHSIPVQESISTSVEGILKKIIDMIKYIKYQQVSIPQFPQAVHPQIPVSYWYPSKDYTFPNAHYMRAF